MGMMTCVMCGREMTRYHPLRRCQECQEKAFREGIYRSFEHGHNYQSFYSAEPEPETTDWIRPMGEKFRVELGLDPTTGQPFTELSSKTRHPNWRNLKPDQFDLLEAERYHQLERRSEGELLSIFSAHEQATLRFYRHMVELGVVEHQTEPASDDEEQEQEQEEAL